MTASPAEAHANKREHRARESSTALASRGSYDDARRSPRAYSMPGIGLYALCTGALAGLGGLVVAALVAPASPDLIWLLAACVLTGVAGLVAGPVLRAVDRHRTR